MKKIFIFITLFILSLTSSAKGINSLEIDELESYLQKNVIVIDIRKEKYWKRTGIIPSSYRLTYDNKSKKFNKDRWNYILIRLIKQKDRAFVLISKDGKDAKNLAKKLYKSKKLSGVMYLKGGISAWLDADRRVINY